MVRALTVLLLCQLAGEMLARLSGLPVPGPVIGLVFLVTVLLLMGPAHRLFGQLENTTNGILGALGLLFVPAGVGVIQQLGLLGDYWLPILLTLILSTIVTLLATVWTFLGVKKLMVRTHG